MFVALADLRHAKGRFLLMTSVIALITVLVGFLAALATGLGRASTSAIVDLPVQHLAFSQPAGADPSFTESQVDQEQWENWAAVPGVASADPLGVAQTRASAGDTTASLTAFGIQPGSHLVSEPVADGSLVLSADAAEALNTAVGEPVSMAGLTLTVSSVVDADAEFAHTPVVWMSLADWQAVGSRAGGPASAPVATVVAVQTTNGKALPAEVRLDADTRLNTNSLGLTESRSAIGSFAAENLSLTMMQAFLVVISALVVGAFFTVWTINRGRDIAVLKALGSSTSYLLRDAIGQAAVVLAIGTGTGALLAAGLGTLASTVMPVVISVSTIILPALLLAVLGLIGAFLATRQITRIDPHAALAAR